MKIPELPKLTKLFNEAQLTRLELQNEHEHIILEKKPAPSISQLPSTAQTSTSKPGPTPKLPSTTQVVKAPPSSERSMQLPVPQNRPLSKLGHRYKRDKS
nr:hypothetical protein [Liquorilactobacillus satsumensis]